MKKYLSSLLLSLAIFLFLPLLCGAASVIDFATGWENKQSELSQIESKYGTNMEIAHDSIPYYDKAYIVYYFDDLKMNQYDKTDSFKEMITDYYTWKVPTEGDGLVTVANLQDVGWLTTECVSPYQKIKSPWNLIIDKNLVASTVRQISSNISNLKYVESFYYLTTFVYFESDGKEYLIPFSANPNFNGLENGKIYDPDEVVSTLEKSMGIPDPNAKDVFGGAAGSAPQSNSLNFTFLIIGSSVALIILAGAAIFVYKRKTAKNK